MKLNCLYDKLVSIDQLKKHPKNRNKHPKDQIKRLAKILDYQGWRYPIKISKQSGYITSGHGRLDAAKLNKWDQVPVNYQDYENQEQEFADVQSDNAVALWAELDIDAIKLDLKELTNFDPELLGIKDLIIEDEEKEKIEDEVPEVKENVIKIGDLIELGNHRLFCGDCTLKENVEKLMCGERAILWHSDPPYGINYVANQESKGFSSGYKNIKNDEKQDEELKEFIYNCIIASLPFMHKNFAFYMWHAMKMQAYFSQAAAAAGILFHRQIIWNKPNFVFGRCQYHWKHELCLMGWLKGDEPVFYGEKNQTTVWDISKENDKLHPTQKPVKIFEIPILNHTKQNEIVYEPFAGSGSNMVACEKTNRKCFMMELDENYCDVICARYVKYSGNNKIKINGKEVEWKIEQKS